MTKETHTSIYSMSENEKKALSRAESIIKDCNVILEIVDARIARSTSDLLNYEDDPILKNIPRIIRFTFQDRADRKMMQEWTDFFRSRNIWVLDDDISKMNNAEQIVMDLYGKGVISLKTFANNTNEPIKIAMVGVPKVGRRTFIQQCINNFKQAKSVLNILNLKNKVYELSDNLQIIEVPSILGVNFTDPEAFWNLQIFSKTVKNNVEMSGLALNAFLQIAKFQPDLLANRYNLNINQSLLTGKKANQYVLDAFHEIAIANNLKDEFDNFSVLMAFELFIKEVRNGTLGRLCLEKADN